MRRFTLGGAVRPLVRALRDGIGKCEQQLIYLGVT
jgi:hypothetical protein